MSMPVLSYGCTVCDVKGWDALTWGFRYYQVGQERVRIAVGVGWCHECKAFAPIEKRPDVSTEKQLLAELDALRMRIREIQQSLPKPRLWLFQSPKPMELVHAESDLERAEESLQRLRLLIPLMADRKSGDRCLHCSSEDCFRIPQDVVHASFDEFSDQPVQLSCTHPGCGGNFTVINDGLRLNIAGRSRAYDLDGKPLRDWEPL